MCEPDGRIDASAVDGGHLTEWVENDGRPARLVFGHWRQDGLDVTMNRFHARPLNDHVRLPLHVATSTAHDQATCVIIMVKQKNRDS